jgi:hypothetical protein
MAPKTVINDPRDVGVGRSLPNLDYLRDISRNVNRRLLAMERTAHNCTIALRSFESVVLPSDTDGQHVPGLRFGNPRVMAVLAGLCLFLPTPDGFTNAMLRERIAALFDPGPRGYGRARMTYDLRRLRLKGLTRRLPGKNRYVVTPMGRRIALFFSKAFARILRPDLARIDPEVPADASDVLAEAWRRIDHVLDCHVQHARLAA